MTTETKTVQDMTPEEIDEILFPLWARRWQLAERIHSYRESLGAAIWPAAAPIRNGMRIRGINSVQMNQWNKMLHEAEAEKSAVEFEIQPYDVEFETRGGWSRFILCGNNNGHLHYNGCSTLRMKTRILLIPAASGLDDGQVVGTFGETACSKCFPGAPVAPKVKELPEGVCEGSGTYEVDDVKGSFRLYRPWGRCRKCGASASVTSTGKIRQHKIKES